MSAKEQQEKDQRKLLPQGQLKDELKGMGKIKREALLKECLGKEFKIIIPQVDIIPVKADLVQNKEAKKVEG